MINSQLRQFLRSLINTTLILAIVFAFAGIILVNRIESFTSDVISDVKFGLLQEIDQDVKLVASSIRDADQNLRLIAQRLSHIIEQPNISLSPAMQSNVRTLNRDLSVLNQNISQLLSSHAVLSDQAIRQIASIIASSIIKIRNCHSQQIAKVDFNQKMLHN